MLRDAVTLQSTIWHLGLTDVFRERSVPLTEAAEDAINRAGQFQNNIQALAQTVIGLATVGAIVICAQGAISGDLSFGALIAVIALVSKVIAPIHGLHSNMAQILSFRQSQAQADRVLALGQEMEIGLAQSHQKNLSGRIVLSNVTYRPDPHMPPLLSQASLACAPGEIVLIFGTDVAARTAVLDLMDGMFTPIAGSVEHDDIDIRQIARDDLRNSVSYATFEPGLFYGTVAQNFRLASPTLTDADIAQALIAAGIHEEVAQLPNGSDTRLTDAILSELPREFIKAKSLARCIARDTSVFLFSEPTIGLSHQRRVAFKDWLNQMAGKRTIVLATADRSLFDYADRFVFLENGRVTVNDTGQAGLKKLKAALNKRG